MNLKSWTLLFILAFLWGASFLFGRIIVMEMPPLSLVFWRVGLAAIALYIYLMIRPTRFKLTFQHWTAFAVMGLLNNIIPFGLIFYGQQEIGAGLASIINAMTPIWSLIIAHLMTADEKLSINKLIGILMGFAGVALLIGIPTLDNLDASFLAQIAVIGATISYGFASVYGRRFANIPPIQTAKGQLCASAVIIFPIVLIVDQPWNMPIPSTTAILCIIALALACTALAYIIFFTILANAGAVNVSLVTLLVPLSSILLGSAVLAEKLSGTQLLAMGIILAGLILVDGRLVKRIF